MICYNKEEGGTPRWGRGEVAYSILEWRESVHLSIWGDAAARERATVTAEKTPAVVAPHLATVFKENNGGTR